MRARIQAPLYTATSQDPLADQGWAEVRTAHPNTSGGGPMVVVVGVVASIMFGIAVELCIISVE